MLALGAVGIAELGLGRFREAAESVREALAEARQHQVVLFEEARLLTHLGRAQLGLGDREGALRGASDAVDVARRQGARVTECLALLSRARIRRATGAPAGDVEADLASALVLPRETEASAYEAEIAAEQ